MIGIQRLAGHQGRLITQRAAAALALLSICLRPWSSATNTGCAYADAALAPLSGYMRAALAAAENAEAEVEHHQLPQLAISSPNKVISRLHGALLLYLPSSQDQPADVAGAWQAACWICRDYQRTRELSLGS